MSSTDSRTPVEDLESAAVDGIDDEETLTAESLIEEVSIDGMCGVY